MSEEDRKAKRRADERQALAENDKTARFADWYDTSEAAEALGFTEMHTKALVRKGKLSGVKIAFRGYKKWLLDPESVEGYEAKSFGPTGMRRYVLRVDPTHVDINVVRDFLEESFGAEGIDPDTGDVVFTLRRPRTSKSKSKGTSSDEPFVPTIASYGLPPEPTEPSVEPTEPTEDDE